MLWEHEPQASVSTAFFSVSFSDAAWPSGQRGRVDSASRGPGFESRSGHYLDLFHGKPSSNPRPRL